MLYASESEIKGDTAIEISQSTKATFLNSCLYGTYDLTFFLELDKKKALAAIETEFDEIIGLNAESVKEERARFFNVSNTCADDYAERVIEVSKGKYVLAGIRHVDANPEKPFIHIWPDFVIEDKEQLHEIANISSQVFSKFAPKHISVWLNPVSALAQDVEKEITPNLRYMAGYAQDVRSLSFPKHYEALTLKRVQESNYYEWYEDIYRAFHRECPELKNWVPTNDFEDMENSRRQGLLYYALHDDQKVGIIAGEERSLLGESGVYFIEILLDKTMRGKGFAPVLQRQFIENLDHSYELIWGTIDAHNIPSTKTSLKTGRHAVRAEYFIPIFER